MGIVAPESLDELVTRFEEVTLPRAEWTHAAHLRVGAWHVDRHGADGALPLLRERIQRLNRAHGTLNTPTTGYHETITAAYVTLIATFLAAADPRQPLERHVERLLAGPLGERRVLLRFWSEEVLMSSRARAAWVAPDRAPLALPGDDPNFP
jgi:hypothetical protein